jgi:hypothetical protein
VAKSRKITSIPELVEDEKKGPEQAIAALRKHLKSGTGIPYPVKSNYLTEIFARRDANVKRISEAKRTQWRIASFSLLLIVAVTGAVLITRHLAQALAYTVAFSAVAALAIALICWVARKMLDITEADLRFYREHGKLNEEMLNTTLGIDKLAAAVVSARQPEFEDRRSFGNGAALAGWLYGSIVGAAVIAFAVSELLIWLT